MMTGFVLIAFLALLTVAGINLAYEFTFGRKRWKQFKSTPKKQRRKFKQVLKDLWIKIFSRDKTKGFVWVGLIILFMRFFVRLNIYYIVFACVVFTLAAISRFAPPINRDTIKGETNEGFSEAVIENT